MFVTVHIIDQLCQTLDSIKLLLRKPGMKMLIASAQTDLTNAEEEQAQLVNSCLIPWYQSFAAHVEAVKDLISKFLVCLRMICFRVVVEYLSQTWE